MANIISNPKNLWTSETRLKLQTKGGFTLIEIMIASLVFGILAIIFSGTVIAALRAGHLNGQYAQAASLCQHKIDQLRAIGFGRLTYTELSDAQIIDETPSSQPYSFTLVDEVRDYLPQASTALRITTVNSSVFRITVTISWRNAGFNSKTSSLSMNALITNAE
jgi:prepilin-type N-terminal cleavage/methylation domain-containing protein